MNNSYIYAHIRHDTNEVFYIGVGTKDKKALKSKTLSYKYKRAYGIERNVFWNNIVNKSKYTIHILHDNLLRIEACKIEVSLIAFHGRRDLGHGTLCNLTDGGEGTSNRIRKNTFYKKYTNIETGEIFLGLKEAGLSINKSSQYVSNAIKSKIRNFPIRKYIEGQVEYEIFNKKYKNNSTITHKVKSILQYDLEDNFIKEWASLKEASESLKIQASGISSTIKGRLWSSGGYKWRYKNETNEDKLNLKNLRFTKKVGQYDLNYNLIEIFNSARIASEKTGVHMTNIVEVVNNNRKTAGKFIWKYIN